jgi:Holliday junction resolvase RusA-like endonuclease
MELKLRIPLPTSLNKLYVNQYKYNARTKKNEPTGARVLSKEGKLSKALIQKAAKNQMKKQKWDYEYTKDNYIYLDSIIYFNKKGRDDNNLYKLLCDALEKIVYDNDSRVLIRTMKIFYDAENPRMELHIHPVEYIGIFDDQSCLDKFESVCKNCSRYARNCSILNKAKEGRIQEEIDSTFTCSKFKEKK